MADETQIANLAAVRMGADRMLSLDDDREVARTIKAVFAIERQATLRDGQWNFAMQRAGLPALSDPAPFQFTHVYQLPAGCLKLVEVLNAATECDWQVEGRRILANVAGPLWVRYVADVPQLPMWDVSAAEALALRLAWKCGRRIAGSAYDEAAGEAEYRAAISAARRADAHENPPVAQAESSWIDARHAPTYDTGRPGSEIW